MCTLETKLKNFNPSSENDLLKDGIKDGSDNPFFDLAKSFLYGGYVSVKDNTEQERYRIYIRTVEFYCHCESDNSNLPKDPIVYHRNGKYMEYKKGKTDKIEQGEVPYFPLMAFHAHASGIDITFEKPELKLRSSALIRAYEVYDVQRKVFLTYDKKSRLFVDCNDKKKRVNTQSTYLYYFLNGFIGDYVKWEDDWKDELKAKWNDIEKKAFKIAPRRNVFEYDEKGEILKKNGRKVKDEKKKWSYTRTEDLLDVQLE